MQAERPTGKHVDKQKNHERQAEVDTHAQTRCTEVSIYLLYLLLSFINILYYIYINYTDTTCITQYKKQRKLSEEKR